MTIITLAEAMAKNTQRRLEMAQELGMECCHCHGPIKLFCCGETFPLSEKDAARVKLDYGKLWTNGDAELLPVKALPLLQELLNIMYKEDLAEIHLHQDGYVQVDK